MTILSTPSRRTAEGRLSPNRAPSEEMVSWLDCQEFCAKLAELTDKPIQLPTEAERGYACRAGTTSEYFSGDGEEALNKVGWYSRNSGKQTHVVGEKDAANPWGLFDVHGNVWEWCQDWFEQFDPLGRENQIDPKGPSHGGNRVCRGGAWGYNAGRCRAACRDLGAPGLRYDSVGLRVCFRLD